VPLPRREEDEREQRVEREERQLSFQVQCDDLLNS
jgi:hypothetical protein